jgi:hypothetical protein
MTTLLNKAKLGPALIQAHTQEGTNRFLEELDAALVGLTQASIKGDANYAMLPADEVLILAVVLTAPRAWYLPLAANVGAGKTITIMSVSAGAISPINTLTIVPIGSDSINGGTQYVLVQSYSVLQLMSDGVARWTVMSSTPTAYLNTFTDAGSEVSLVSNVAKTAAVLTLPAGDWDINGSVAFDPDATTNVIRADASISTTTNSPAAVPDITLICWGAFVPGTTFAIPTPTRRLLLTATGTVYLVARAVFTVSTMFAYGQIRARRMN